MSRGPWVKRVGIAALVVAIWACAPARASAGAQTLALRVELLEQAACLAGPDQYRASFELRTVYINTGRAPVELGLQSQQIVAAEVLEAGGHPEAARATFGATLARDDDAVARIADPVVVEAGQSVTGRSTVWLPLAVGVPLSADGLVPGSYDLRVEVRVAARVAGAAGATQPARHIHLAASSIAVDVRGPTQVQECGSFLPLLPSP